MVYTHFLILSTEVLICGETKKIVSKWTFLGKEGLGLKKPVKNSIFGRSKFYQIALVNILGVQ